MPKKNILEEYAYLSDVDAKILNSIGEKAFRKLSQKKLQEHRELYQLADILADIILEKLKQKK